MIRAIRNLFVPPKQDEEFFAKLWREFEDTQKWIDESTSAMEARFQQDKLDFDNRVRMLTEQITKRPTSPPYVTVAECCHCLEDTGEPR